MSPPPRRGGVCTQAPPPPRTPLTKIPSSFLHPYLFILPVQSCQCLGIRLNNVIKTRTGFCSTLLEKKTLLKGEHQSKPSSKINRYFLVRLRLLAPIWSVYDC